jgi:D-3-phosphoglycerate dehydrogenase
MAGEFDSAPFQEGTAFFVNTCRGKTVDEQAPTLALERGEIAGAGLDVFEQEPVSPDNPLLKMDNVVVTPRTAGFSVNAAVSGMRSAGQETAGTLKGMWPMSLVNPPVRAKIPQRLAPTNQ